MIKYQKTKNSPQKRKLNKREREKIVEKLKKIRRKAALAG